MTGEESNVPLEVLTVKTRVRRLQVQLSQPHIIPCSKSRLTYFVDLEPALRERPARMIVRRNDYHSLLAAGLDRTPPMTLEDLRAAFDAGGHKDREELTLRNSSKWTSRATPTQPLIAGVRVCHQWATELETNEGKRRHRRRRTL